MMKQVEISEPGGPEVLVLREAEIPEPKSFEVLIKVVAAGVNRPDIVQRQGNYKPPEGASEIPGLEVSGIITRVGHDVRGYNVGDKVCALLTGGGYAEYCCAPASQILPIPDGISIADASCIPETFFTVWSNLFMSANLVAGEKCLIHGGASGIGTTAIQLANLFGAEVIATAGSDEKIRSCYQLGAKFAINYKSQDFVTEISKFTKKNGVNVILDIIGGEYVNKNISCLSQYGRLIQIAFQNGVNGELNLAKVMFKNLTITGSALRPASIEYKAEIAQQLYKHVWPLFTQGKLKIPIYQRFSIFQAAEAHKCLEKGEHTGKIVLDVINDDEETYSL